MARDYHTAQDDFGSIVQRLQPMVLTNFVMWLDMKVAEFKVYGQMLLGEFSRESRLTNYPIIEIRNALRLVNQFEQICDNVNHNKYQNPYCLVDCNRLGEIIAILFPYKILNNVQQDNFPPFVVY